MNEYHTLNSSVHIVKTGYRPIVLQCRIKMFAITASLKTKKDKKAAFSFPYNSKIRAEPILGSATRFGRISGTRQYSVLGRQKPAETEY